MKNARLLFASLLVAPGLLAAPPEPSPAPVTLVRAGALVDVLAGEVRKDQDILIEGGRIRQVGPSLEPPARATLIDLRAKTLLPGHIDGRPTGGPGGKGSALLSMSQAA